MSGLHPPNTSNGWSRLSLEAQAEIMDGALAIRRIRQHEDYSHWVRVGRALLRLQEEAMHLSGSNSPHGRRYTAIRGDLGGRVPDLEEIDNAAKAHAVWLAKNFAAVEKWRAEIGETKRQQYNHPSSIKRRYDATHSVAKEPGLEPRPLAPSARKDAEIARLQEELDAANAKLRRVERDTERGPLVTPNAATNEAIAVLRQFFSATKGAAIAAGWMASYQANKAAPVTQRTRRSVKASAEKVAP